MLQPRATRQGFRVIPPPPPNESGCSQPLTFSLDGTASVGLWHQATPAIIQPGRSPQDAAVFSLTESPRAYGEIISSSNPANRVGCLPRIFGSNIPFRSLGTSIGNVPNVPLSSLPICRFVSSRCGGPPHAPRVHAVLQRSRTFERFPDSYGSKKSCLNAISIANKASNNTKVAVIHFLKFHAPIKVHQDLCPRPRSG